MRRLIVVLMLTASVAGAIYLYLDIKLSNSEHFEAIMRSNAQKSIVEYRFMKFCGIYEKYQPVILNRVIISSNSYKQNEK